MHRLLPVRFVRRVVAGACVAIAAHLTVASVAAARPDVLCPRSCQRYAAAVDQRRREQQVAWYWASQLTLRRAWFATVVLGTPHARCVIGHEAANVTPTPFYAYDGDPGAAGNWGAFQFSRGTFAVEAGRAGRGDLVGKTPVEPGVPWYDQTEVYAQTYEDQGDAPWGNRC